MVANICFVNRDIRKLKSQLLAVVAACASERRFGSKNSELQTQGVPFQVGV
jgi:hypothetical protein